MNKYSVLSLLLLLSVFACAPEETYENPDTISPEIEGTESGGLVQMEFVGALSDESRTYLDGTHVMWTGDDKIAVLDNAAPYVHQFDNTDDGGGATCRFVGEAKAGETTWYVFYPYSAGSYDNGLFFVDFPKTQKAVAGGFADGAFLTAAKTTVKNFEMQALSSLVKITISYDNIKKVTLEARDGSDVLRPLSGRFQLNRPNLGQSDFAEHPWMSYLGGSYSRDGVELVPPDGSDYIAPGTYYMSVASFEAAGLDAISNTRLTFTRNDGETASRSTTASWTPGQGKFLDLGTVDEKLSWSYFDIEFGTEDGIIWPFTQYRVSTDDGETWGSWLEQPANLKTTLGYDLQFKLKDNGHLLSIHADEEQIRYTTNANAIYCGGEVGNYIQFPAVRNRALRRVEVFYDSTYVYGDQVGWAYCKNRPLSESPHIKDTLGNDASYVVERFDENGFDHFYDLFDTEVGWSYRYVQVIDGGSFTGPRIQRIRLYYSDEAHIEDLTLPSSISASGYSTALRKSNIEVSLTAGSEKTAGSSAYDVGIVVRNMRRFAHAIDEEYPSGHQYDTVIFLNGIDPAIVGTTLTWTRSNLHTYNNDRLNLEYDFYPFVRIKGDDTNPVTMTPGASGTNWKAGSLSTITRPVYTWTENTTTNYLYASDTQVTLNAAVNIKSPAAQRYDLGFIYREDGGDDDDWNYAFLDQHGPGTGNVIGYWFDGDSVSGCDTTFTATITGLTPGQAYEYKPVVMQHAACFYGYGGEEASREAYQYTYIPYADGYNDSNDLITDINGPVPVINAGASGTAAGTYLSASTGQITISGTATTIQMDVGHVDPSIRGSVSFITGFVYNNGSVISTRNSKTIPSGSSSIISSTLVYPTTNSTSSPSTLVSLPDVDNTTVTYCPYFAFVTGGVQGVPYTPSGYSGSFTCPVVSTPTSGDYLWRTYNTADLSGTIAIGDSNCKMEIGYSTDGGSTWTTSTQNLAAGAKTISSATGITEGGQTVKFGARRSGSSDASTWKTLDIELAHPIASVYTYGSSEWPSASSVRVSGSYSLTKVASNASVVYGVQYFLDEDDDFTRDEGETLYSATVAGTGTDPDAYYSILLDSNVSGSTSASYPIVYWFFARLSGSSATPGSVDATSGSSRSSTLASSTFGYGSGSYRRLMMTFNTFYNKVGGYINPFLPTSASGYISELGNSVTGTMVQSASALITGGHTVNFSLTSGAAKYSDADTHLSGVLYNNAGSSAYGSLRVYSNSVDDYIAFPAISGMRVKHYHSQAAYVIVNYFSDVVSSPSPRIFVSTNDRTLDTPSAGFNTASPAALPSSYDQRSITGSFSNSSYTTSYNGTSQYLRFASSAVSLNSFPSSSAKAERYEHRFRWIVLDYDGD